SVLQDVLHTASPQMNGTHGVSSGTLHAPLPVQYACSAIPSKHDGIPQGCSCPGYVQTGLAPSQLPRQSGSEPAQLFRAPCGSPYTREHTPSFPSASQASHALSQIVLQQTKDTFDCSPYRCSSANVAR